MSRIKEIWLELPNYDGYYEVSNLGKVRNSRTKKILTPFPTQAGYLRVCLVNKRLGNYRCQLVHRLVAMTFLENWNEELREVNHIDENKNNNRVSNLEWIDRLNNLRHGTRTQRAIKTRRRNARKKLAEEKKQRHSATDLIYAEVKYATKN